MNHETAADFRQLLNAKDYIRRPDDEHGGHIFDLVRVQQPGYLNDDPIYEVIMRIEDPESFHLPTNLLELVSDRDCYLRVKDGEIHIRDWTTEEGL